jgi:hypothetical protein
MTKERAAKARKNAWSPEARRKRELTMQRKRAAKEATESVELTADQLAAAVSVPVVRRGRKPKTLAVSNTLVIQLLELAVKLLKETQ